MEIRERYRLYLSPVLLLEDPDNNLPRSSNKRTGFRIVLDRTWKSKVVEVIRKSFLIEQADHRSGDR